VALRFSRGDAFNEITDVIVGDDVVLVVGVTENFIEALQGVCEVLLERVAVFPAKVSQEMKTLWREESSDSPPV